MMKNKPTKGDKREIRQEMHMTRPPRMEGAVKEARMKDTKKKPVAKPKKKAVAKTQSTHTEAERKGYHLKTPKQKHAPRIEKQKFRKAR